MAGVCTAGRVRVRMLLMLAAGVLLAGDAVAQPDAVAPPPSNPFQRAQVQDPPPVVPRNTTPLGQPNELLATTPPSPVAPSPTVTLAQPILGDPLPPLPGSIEDEYQQELAARRGYQASTWWGAHVTALPNSLLWEPPLAVKKDPRMQFLASDLANYRGNYTIDTNIGMTMGLYRVKFEGADLAAQVDIFGTVQTRLTPDDLIAADYRFGLPVTFRWGWWQAKVGYEHTSTHLGDEFIRTFGGPIPSFAKDELVIGLGRILYDNLRVYGHFGYAFSFQVPGRQGTSREKARFDLGAEWFLRCPTGWAGSPFAAANVEWRGDQGYTPNYTFQAGWLWRNPTQRLGTFRLFAEHYRGSSPFGQFMATREQFTSFGFGFDY
jgi:hypothetical protein